MTINENRSVMTHPSSWRYRFPPPTASPPGLIHEDLQGIVRRALRAKPETAHGRSPPQRPARARSSARPARCGPEPQRSPTACIRCCPAWGSTPAAPAAAASSSAAVRRPARRAAGPPRTPRPRPRWSCRCPVRRCCAHRHPRPPQDVFAVDLVLQRVKPSIRVGLGRPVQRVLQRSDSVASDSRQGGPSRDSGTHQSVAPNMRVNEAAALPSPRVVLSRGSIGTTTASDSLPTPHPLPGSSPVIGRRSSTDTAIGFGRGGPPQFPPPSERSTPSTPDSSSRLHLQDAAFAVIPAARHCLIP